jgi:hypothetical protein
MIKVDTQVEDSDRWIPQDPTYMSNLKVESNYSSIQLFASTDGRAQVRVDSTWGL